MPVARPAPALPALANQTVPRRALRDATSDTHPEHIPRAREARALRTRCTLSATFTAAAHCLLLHS